MEHCNVKSSWELKELLTELIRNLPWLLMQDLLDNTAVSGSNEGIIRIWEISSEKFVRFCTIYFIHCTMYCTSKVLSRHLNLLLQETWLLWVWGGECIETDQGGWKQSNIYGEWIKTELAGADTERSWRWATYRLENGKFKSTGCELKSR